MNEIFCSSILVVYLIWNPVSLARPDIGYTFLANPTHSMIEALKLNSSVVEIWGMKNNTEKGWLIFKREETKETFNSSERERHD